MTLNIHFHRWNLEVCCFLFVCLFIYLLILVCACVCLFVFFPGWWWCNQWKKVGNELKIFLWEYDLSATHRPQYFLQTEIKKKKIIKVTAVQVIPLFKDAFVLKMWTWTLSCSSHISLNVWCLFGFVFEHVKNFQYSFSFLSLHSLHSCVSLHSTIPFFPFFL